MLFYVQDEKIVLVFVDYFVQSCDTFLLWKFAYFSFMFVAIKTNKLLILFKGNSNVNQKHCQ